MNYSEIEEIKRAMADDPDFDFGVSEMAERYHYDDSNDHVDQQIKEESLKEHLKIIDAKNDYNKAIGAVNWNRMMEYNRKHKPKHKKN
jgi:hypothetical protein